MVITENAVEFPKGSEVKVEQQYGIRWHEGPRDGQEHWFTVGPESRQMAERRARRFDVTTASEDDPEWVDLIVREVATVYGPAKVVDQ